MGLLLQKNVNETVGELKITLTHHVTQYLLSTDCLDANTYTKTTGTNMHKTLPYIFPAVHPLLMSFNLVS